jgi:hypothetical protein
MNLGNNKKNVESFGKCWKIGVVEIGKKVMANDLSHLHYNLEVRNQT